MSLLILLQNLAGGGSGTFYDNSCTLFMAGHSPINSNTTLFISGSGNSINNNHPLYINGYSQQTNNTTLFVNGTTNTGLSRSLNLYTTTPSPSAYNGSTTLVVSGGDPGVGSHTGGIDLFLESAQGNTPSGRLNLFIQGPLYDSTIRNMNMYVSGANQFTAGSMSLVLYNEMFAKSTTLFIKGSGNTAGALPLTGTLNLFINRMPSDAITLYMRGPGEPATQSMTCVVSGAFLFDGSMTLVIPSTIGRPTGTLKLYTHGF